MLPRRCQLRQHLIQRDQYLATRLLRNNLAQEAAKRFPATSIDPTNRRRTKVKPPRFRGNPNFAIGRLPIDDDLAAIFERKRQNPAREFAVDICWRFVQYCLQAQE